MKNYIGHGNSVIFTNDTGADIMSGTLTVIGALAGIAAGPVPQGATGVLHLGGVYDLPKLPEQAWSFGAAIYRDAATGLCTSVKTGNRLIGAAITPAAAGTATGQVRLNGVAA